MNRESSLIEDYLVESEYVNYSHASIQELAAQLASQSPDDITYAKNAFEFVRDAVSHSWDIQSSRITCSASDVLQYREGICYAKSNLLCALLRARGIPAGFCYQRLTLGDTPDTGYVVHALNAVYMKELDRWIRLDARGNKQGVDAQFSLDEERLAFAIRGEYEEVDYPVIYASPRAETMESLRAHTDCRVMYASGLPVGL
ncbi:transglutaminase domain protein [Paenibacillus curdlanolyticus YK9]|uniref:Transglutaminase domain protein n=1 Tax=Paenibacillus curdlanolyticus YK9 TaxID=717606 RepID=E0IA71_9BACL|nr:transglutaminase domain protein [Paenibacillus curdlanolyticus YK9]